MCPSLNSLVDAPDMSSLLQWLRDFLHFDVSSNPNYSPLQVNLFFLVVSFVTLGARGFFSFVCGEIEQRSGDRGVALQQTTEKTLWHPG